MKLKNAGIMHGAGENVFAPKGNLSCEQAVAMVVRLFDQIKEQEQTK